MMDMINGEKNSNSILMENRGKGEDVKMEVLGLFGVILLGGVFLGIPVAAVMLIKNSVVLKNLEALVLELRRKQTEQSSILEQIRRHVGTNLQEKTASATEPSPIPGAVKPETAPATKETAVSVPMSVTAPSLIKPEVVPSAKEPQIVVLPPVPPTPSMVRPEVKAVEKEPFAAAAISTMPQAKPETKTVVKELSHSASPPASAQEMKSEVSERLSEFSRKTEEAIERIVQWLCVGEEFRNPKVSPEYAVATTWLVRVGVLILLFGVAYSLKYSIDNNLIRPEIRVAASFLAGVGMVAGGLYALKGRYQGIASGIIGAGFVTCYLSVFFAYKTFSLIPYGYSFAVMLAVVAVAGIIAIWKDQLLPAVIGTLGGYAVPILLSRGTMDLTGLFTFASFLSVFVLLGSAIRSWRILHLLAFTFNALIYIAAGMKVGFSNYKLCIFFFCVNFAIFAVIPLVCRLFRRLSVTLVEVLLLIFNYLLFLGLSLTAALHYVSDKDFASWLMLGTALFTGAQYALLYFMKKEERALSAVLSVMTFGSLALFVCLYFSWDWLNTALAVLSVAMTYAGVRTANKALIILSWITCVLLGVSAFLYANHLTSCYPQLAIERFFSLGIFAAALGVNGMLVRRCDPEYFPEAREISFLFLGLAGIQFFYYSSLEIHDLMAAFLPVFRNGALTVYWSLFALTLLLSGILVRFKPLRATALGLFVVCALKVFFVDLEDAGTLPRIAAFLAIGIVMILGAVLYARFRERFETVGEEKKI